MGKGNLSWKANSQVMGSEEEEMRDVAERGRYKLWRNTCQTS